LSINIRDADILLDTLLDYFTCQARGYSVNNTCHAEYDRFEPYLRPKLNAVTYTLLGLVPWSNLLFAIQVSDIKRAVQIVVRFYKNRDSQSKTVSSSANQ